MTKTSKTTRKAAPHTKIMGAVTKSLSDGRMRAFMDTPNEETRDAIVDQVRKNLTALMKGRPVSKTADKSDKIEKTAKSEKVKRVAKKVKVAAETDKIERAILRRAEKAHAAIIRLKEKTDDADKIKSSVSRLLKKNGLDVVSVRSSGTAKIERSGSTFMVKFNNKSPVVTAVQ